MRDDGDPIAQRCASETVYMLDQCHNIEPKVPAMIRSVMNLQETIAKALVDRGACRRAGRGRRPGGQPVPPGRVLTESGRCSPSCARPAGSPRTRTAPTSRAARPRPGSRPAPAARRPAGADDGPR
jgi:hypothetical protein